jgi:hypothetical protein
MSLNTTLNSPADSSDKAGRKACGRSRVTNGHALLPDLPGLDGRSAWIRRCKDLIAEHVSDLGGEDNCSAAERSLVRRCAVITTELEMLEAKFAAAGQAKPDDLDLYQRTAGNLRRLLLSLGLQRRSRDVTDDYVSAPDLSAFEAQLREIGEDSAP